MKNIVLLFTALLLFGCTGDLVPKPSLPKIPHIKADSTQTVSSLRGKDPWIGKWRRLERNFEADLEITDIRKGYIYFNLTAVNGASSGEVTGRAKVKSGRAIYRMTDYGSSTCEIRFTLLDDKRIEVSQRSGLCGAGMGVEYSGEYINEKFVTEMPEPTLVSLGMLQTKKQEDIFKKLVGDKYDAFINTTQYVSEIEDLDNMNFKGHSAAIRGLYTSMENIILYNDRNEFWCAVINDDERVYYFTNSQKFRTALPLTIDAWRENFKDKEVVFVK